MLLLPALVVGGGEGPQGHRVDLPVSKGSGTSPVRFGVFTIERIFDGYSLLINLSVDFL